MKGETRIAYNNGWIGLRSTPITYAMSVSTREVERDEEGRPPLLDVHRLSRA